MPCAEIEKELRSFRGTLIDLGDTLNLSEDEGETYWDRICDLVNKGLIADLPENIIAQNICVARETIMSVITEHDASLRTTFAAALQENVKPVGCCPKCNTLWYAYERFCAGCGFKRMDF